MSSARKLNFICSILIFTLLINIVVSDASTEDVTTFCVVKEFSTQKGNSQDSNFYLMYISRQNDFRYSQELQTLSGLKGYFNEYLYARIRTKVSGTVNVEEDYKTGMGHLSSLCPNEHSGWTTPFVAWDFGGTCMPGSYNYLSFRFLPFNTGGAALAFYNRQNSSLYRSVYSTDGTVSTFTGAGKADLTNSINAQSDAGC